MIGSIGNLIGAITGQNPTAQAAKTMIETMVPMMIAMMPLAMIMSTMTTVMNVLTAPIMRAITIPPATTQPYEVYY